jgi:hypothetical protein
MISVSLSIRNLLYLLIFYISLEELLLKWLPVSDGVFEGLHIISDFIVVLILCLYLTAGSYRYRINATNLAWVFFISVSLMSFVLSYATFSGYFAKLWVQLRYILIYFILLKIRMSKDDLNRFYIVLAITFCIQIFIGILLFLDVSIINAFFQAREGIDKVIVKEDTIKGTFKFGVFYGFFIMSSFVILYPYVRNWYLKILLVAATLVFTYYSGSRMVVLGVIGFLVYMHYQRNKILMFVLACSGAVFVMFNGIGEGIVNIGSLIGLFSPDFWINSLATGRLGIFNVVPMFFGAGVKELLFGFSYDINGITAFLYQDYDNLSAILRNNAIVGIEDVYWIAFLYYYGLFGIILFGIFYAGVMMRVRRLAKRSLSIGHSPVIKSINYLLIFIILCGFVNQVLYIKTFAFYFWVFAAIASHPVRYIRT